MQRVSHIAPPRAEFELWSSKGKSGPPSKCSSTIEALRLFRATSLYSSVSRDLLSRRNATTAKMTAMHPSMDVFPRLFTCACIHFCSQEMRHDCENDRAASTWMRASLNGRKHPVTTPPLASPRYGKEEKIHQWKHISIYGRRFVPASPPSSQYPWEGKCRSLLPLQASDSSHSPGLEL